MIKNYYFRFLYLFVGCALVVSCMSTSEQKVYQPKNPKGKYILTPKEPDSPIINGPKIFGVRPGSQFLYSIPVTGKRPLEFAVKGLPAGLHLDTETGLITGVIKDKTPKEYALTFVAKNKKGEQKKDFTIVVGKTISLTPPMGWNSWNCWGPNVTQQNVIASAQAMVAKGLANYGWSYINVDDGWQSHRGGKHHGILADSIKFPNMQAMTSKIHKMGLKVGIYSSPWVTTYAGYVGGSSDTENGYWNQSMNDKKLKKKRTYTRVAKYTFDDNDVAQWTDWGIDYLKYDWNPNDAESTIRMANALQKSNRDIVYSLSNTAPIKNAKLYGELVNCFRTYGDLKDRWDGKGSHKSIRDEWVAHREWMKNGFAGAPGHFPDPDMLVIGEVNTRGKNPQPSRLTADEQYSHVSLWSLWAAPLLIGCPIETMDKFTVNLVTNSEVLAIHQDEVAIPGKTVFYDDTMEVVVKQLSDGSKAIGLFNLKNKEQIITVNWELLGISGAQNFRDVWRQKNIGEFTNQFSASVPRHGVIFVKVTAIK
ncbi:putative Ig domain-containing protein [Cellulophaga lytica]|uniref:putative Ig domain-containing protein n=1 Tax=Cellulophaga lytica TaxID=979 RepID=UPI0026E27D97|nr:putative Ig domain-containing protein [Cellulophaga lytica]MDO6854095.1 putative Ig domain-containing protein [Cellulophaga lytica]